jgi:N-acyl-D-aspartate/D-glutamate deacylase
MASLLIKGSTVFDGTGKPGVITDVLIKNDRIVSVGALSAHQADVVIDGTGMITTPGFIDVNTDSDHYLSLFTIPAYAKTRHTTKKDRV